MNDYYRILGVCQSASQAEIKRAYRKKAKELHPDLSAKKSSEFRALVTAYNTLIDSKARQIFDARYNPAKRKPRAAFDYRIWLLSRDDERSVCRLIVYDLLHEREDDAVAAYKKALEENPAFSFGRWFSREEFMDYGFILAEELSARREYWLACCLLEKIILLEKTFSFFKLFYEDVAEFARGVFLKITPASLDDDSARQDASALSDEQAIELWKRALELRLGAETDRALLRNIALAYMRLGDEETARLCYERAK